MSSKLTPTQWRSAAKSLLRGAALAGSLTTLACQAPPQTNHDDVRIAEGEFGVLRGVQQLDRSSIRSSARDVLRKVLVEEFGGVGNEAMVVKKVTTDKAGGVHVRFTQEIHGMPLEGASMVLHAKADGTVTKTNGDFVTVDDLPIAPVIDPDVAIARALKSTHIQNEVLKEIALTYVLGSDRKAYLAWRGTVDYKDGNDPQRDEVFADAVTGKLVARHPRYHYALAMETKDCERQTTAGCGDDKIVSTLDDTISTGDLAVDSAHNYAVATYNYYLNNHKRDSIDDPDPLLGEGPSMTLKSRAHYDRRYNNAYWDGQQMTYGDGDGRTFVPLSQDADVVAHELTHGVTEHSSNMVYANESGALNEAWSDIFGSMVDRQEGATGADIWLVGEDIYTPRIAGDALRNMANPTENGDYDWYPSRYIGTEDQGGVHSNSGIANLAFVLLVDGGVHPRGGTDTGAGVIPSTPVPGIGHESAADIFYAANVGCLTEGASFAEARSCTMDAALTTSDSVAVGLAWDAVGVDANTTAPEAPPDPGPTKPLEDGVTLGGQDSPDSRYQTYTLDVLSGTPVTCTTSASTGDADLYVGIGAEPGQDNVDCQSTSETSNESCTTSVTTSDTTIYAMVHSWGVVDYTNLSITCTSGAPAGGCSGDGPYDIGCSCSVSSDCKSGKCKGGPNSKTCK